MNAVSVFRLYLLRATYLFIVVGLGFLIWPGLLSAPKDQGHMQGVVRSLLAAVSLLAVVGLRYPLKMLPLLLFELLWKAIWLLVIGLPLWSAGAFDAGTRQTWNDCLVGVVLFVLVIPWRYVFESYVRAPGDRWRNVPPSEVSREMKVGTGAL